jgi:hypothetical protein
MEIDPTNGNFSVPKGQSFSPTADYLGLTGRKIWPRVGNALASKNTIPASMSGSGDDVRKFTRKKTLSHKNRIRVDL